MSDLELYSYEDIDPGVGWFVVERTSYTINPNGTKTWKTKGQTKCRTKQGFVTEDEWVSLAKRVIAEHGDSELLEQIKDYVRKLAFMKKSSEKEIEVYATHCLVIGAYKCWKEFNHVIERE